MIKLLESCMENARHQYEDIDPDEMVITVQHTVAQSREDSLHVLVDVHPPRITIE